MKCDGIRKDTTIVGGSTCSFPGAHLSGNFDIWKLFVVNPKHQELMNLQQTNEPSNFRMQETNTHPFYMLL